MNIIHWESPFPTPISTYHTNGVRLPSWVEPRLHFRYKTCTWYLLKMPKPWSFEHQLFTFMLSHDTNSRFTRSRVATNTPVTRITGASSGKPITASILPLSPDYPVWMIGKHEFQVPKTVVVVVNVCWVPRNRLKPLWFSTLPTSWRN